MILFSVETVLVAPALISILIEEREICLQKMNYWRILREHDGINEALSTDMIAKEYHSSRELLYFFHFQSHHVEKSFNFTVRTTVCSQREEIIVFRCEALTVSKWIITSYCNNWRKWTEFIWCMKLISNHGNACCVKGMPTYWYLLTNACWYPIKCYYFDTRCKPGSHTECLLKVFLTKCYLPWTYKVKKLCTQHNELSLVDL